MEHKRTTLKSLQHDTAKRIELKRRQVEMLEKKCKDAKKEMIELQRKSRDLEGLETVHENAKILDTQQLTLEKNYHPEDYTEWARKTVKEALREAKPYGPSFTYRVVLEMLEDYLDKGGDIRPGVGMKFLTDHKEKPIYDFATPSLEALGFHIHHNKLPIPDRYVYFVTKYE